MNEERTAEHVPEHRSCEFPHRVEETRFVAASPTRDASEAFLFAKPRCERPRGSVSSTRLLCTPVIGSSISGHRVLQRLTGAEHPQAMEWAERMFCPYQPSNPFYS